MKTRTVVIVTLSFIVAGIMLHVFFNAINVSRYKTHIGYLNQIVSQYIREYKRFPSSEDDLVNAGWLRKKQTPDGVEYEWSSNRDQSWSSFSILGYLTIHYGVSVDDITEKGGLLYDKNTKEQILLIDGPKKKVFRDIHESISLHWYSLMLQLEEGSRGLETDTEDTGFEYQ